MTKTQKHVYQLRRGTAQEWVSVNPILRQGEPGFEYDTGKLKIGNGYIPWLALPYIDEGSVFNAPTHNEFPKVGKVDILYKAQEENALYQWDDNNNKYQLLSSGDQLIDELVKDIDEVRNKVSEIEQLLQSTIVIYGGSATENIGGGISD